jgi:hypothetical protein
VRPHRQQQGLAVHPDIRRERPRISVSAAVTFLDAAAEYPDPDSEVHAYAPEVLLDSAGAGGSE